MRVLRRSYHGNPDSKIYLDDPEGQVIQDGLDGLGRAVRVGLASALSFRSSVLFVYINGSKENGLRPDSLMPARYCEVLFA